MLSYPVLFFKKDTLIMPSPLMVFWEVYKFFKRAMMEQTSAAASVLTLGKLYQI